MAKNRAEARKLMEKLRYGLATHLAVIVSTRNVVPYRDPAVILIDQLKEIYIDGDLNPLDTTQWYPTLVRKDYKVTLNVTETAVDDPDRAFYENYVCGVRSATIPATATSKSTSRSTGNRRRPTSKSASGWYGRSSATWRRTSPGRSCFIRPRNIAGSPRSRGSWRWSTASTTARASRTSGSTGNRDRGGDRAHHSGEIKIECNEISHARGGGRLVDYDSSG
jgi:hypothetical protein